MKLSCLPVSLYPELTEKKRTLGDWFRFGAALGLDGVDLSVVHLENHTPGYLAGLRQEAADLGLQIAMMVTYADFTHPDAQERARHVDDVRHFIEVGTHLGLEFLRVTAGQDHPGLERAAATDWAVAGLTACLEEAKAAGITLLYENHTKGYAWTHTDFSMPTDIFLDIMRRTEDTDLMLLFDTANTLAVGDDPVAVVEQVKHRIRCIHVNDIAKRGEFTPVVHGTGVAPVEAVFRTMIADGYDGWVSVEEASKQGDGGFEIAVPFCDRTWAAAGGTPRAHPGV
ncbi:MAG: sugar phosphate isomerase/epimerase family protein [Litorilinea sp.]